MPNAGRASAIPSRRRIPDAGIPASNKAGASPPSGSNNPNRSACASSPTSSRIRPSRSIRCEPAGWCLARSPVLGGEASKPPSDPREGHGRRRPRSVSRQPYRLVAAGLRVCNGWYTHAAKPGAGSSSRICSRRSS